MASELMIPGGENRMVLPAYLQEAYGDAPSNIITDDRGNSLTIRGKEFSITAEGETTLLTRRDEEGNEFPLQSLPVIILDYAVREGRSFYEGAFDPAETKEPTCWSKDGLAPDESVAEKQAVKCALCPNAVKGSQVTDKGQSAMACRPYKILAIVPAKRMDLDPLRLRIAQTSIYDGRSPDLKQQGKFAFKNYLDSLKARKLPNTRAIVTSLSFDGTAYPKLLFRAARYLTEEEHNRVVEIMASGKVEEILSDTGTATAGAPKVALAPTPTRAALPAPTKAAAAPTAEVEDEDDRAIREAGERKAARLAAEKAAAEKEWAAKATALRTEKAGGEFMFRQPEAGEDEDDYSIAKATARKAFIRAAAEAAAKPEPAAKFRAQTEGEDDDDYAIARSTFNKAQKAGGAPAAATTAPVQQAAAPGRERGKAAPGKQREVVAEVVAEEVPKGEEKAPEKFLPSALNGSNMGEDEEEGATITAAPTKAAAAPVQKSTAAVEVKGVPADVSKLLLNWDDD